MARIETPNKGAVSASSPVFPGAALAITPADADSFASPVAVYVGTAGDVTIRPAGGGAAVKFVGVPAGALLPCMAIGVDATGTTASNMVAIY